LNSKSAKPKTIICAEPRVVKRVLLGLVVLFAISCGSNSSGPSSTSSAQIAGVWRGTMTTTSVSGGECLAPLFQAAIGGNGSATVTFTQSGSSVSATPTNASNNLNFTGSVNQAAVTMTGSACSGCDASAQCPNSNSIRDIRIQTFAMSGTVAGSNLSGTISATYNVLVAGTSTQVSTLMVSDSLSLTRQ
jgi:hypothetical protein